MIAKLPSLVDVHELKAPPSGSELFLQNGGAGGGREAKLSSRSRRALRRSERVHDADTGRTWDVRLSLGGCRIAKSVRARDAINSRVRQRAPPLWPMLTVSCPFRSTEPS